jgi:hypothetical protein
MARAKHNPFAAKKLKFPHRAFIKREAPFRRDDREEVEAACVRISAGAGYVFYAGSRGDELGCKVYGFDTADKARAMQEWIDTSRIATRLVPQMDHRSGRLGPIQWEASKSKEET